MNKFAPPNSLTTTANTSTETPQVTLKTECLPRPLRFDPDCKKHRQRLLQWCNETWNADFKRPMQGGNPPFYHDCCCAFSRRTYARHAGHPKLQSSQVTRIPTFKDLETSEDFYTWMYKLLCSNKRRGDHCFFPRFNVPHTEDDGVDEEETPARFQELNKRLQEATSMMTRHEETIQTLKTENEQLLHASKSWYQKYQELMDASDKTAEVLYATPMKKNNRNFLVLEDY